MGSYYNGSYAEFLDSLKAAGVVIRNESEVRERLAESQRWRTAFMTLAANGRTLGIEFSVEGDQRHMPIALASMTAKYVREALMQRFNAYWRTFLPQLAPTAGYYSDAQRFLADIAPVLPQSGLLTSQFVRQR